MDVDWTHFLLASHFVSRTQAPRTTLNFPCLLRCRLIRLACPYRYTWPTSTPSNFIRANYFSPNCLFLYLDMWLFYIPSYNSIHVLCCSTLFCPLAGSSILACSTLCALCASFLGYKMLWAPTFPAPFLEKEVSSRRNPTG